MNLRHTVLHSINADHDADETLKLGGHGNGSGMLRQDGAALLGRAAIHPPLPSNSALVIGGAAATHSPPLLSAETLRAAALNTPREHALHPLAPVHRITTDNE